MSKSKGKKKTPNMIGHTLLMEGSGESEIWDPAIFLVPVVVQPNHIEI